MEIRVVPTELDGVVIVETAFVEDERGFFIETYHRKQYHAHGLTDDFVQDNHSRSKKNVLRGLHYQAPPVPQVKLVRCTAGAVLDLAVDLRVGSPTFGRHVMVELSAENKKQLLVPVGFAHAFLTLTDAAELQYKCTEYYEPRADRAIAWNDPELKIAWPITDPILSDRDRDRAISLRQYLAHPDFTYDGV